MTQSARPTNPDPVHVTTLTSGFDRVLRVGAPVFVNFAPGQRRPARTQLRGWASERFLRLNPLGDFDADIRFESGAPWRLKFVASGYVCATDSTFLSGETGSAEGIYVTFPKAIHVHGLRQHQRVHLHATVRYLAVAGQPPALERMRPTRLVDLSLGGCGLSVGATLAQDTRLAIAIPPTPQDAPVMFFGTVRHCSAVPGGYVAGVEFDPHGAEHVRVLDALLGTVADAADPLSVTA